jgi:minor extracellular serine protease Vpr
MSFNQVIKALTILVLSATNHQIFAEPIDIKGSNHTAYLVLVNSDFDSCSLHGFGINIGSRINNIITAYVPHDVPKMWQNTKGIERIHLAKKLKPEMNRAIPDMRVDSVYQGYKLKTGYTGKGVLIGVTDWGFDYSHPNFYDTSLEHSRILAAWDQFKTAGPNPSEFSYGTEYIGEDEILTAQSDTAGLYDYAYHGSHVAGIAGGSGAGTDYRGVAYEANFLMVSLRLDEAGALDAFAWMKEKADELEMPLVVNMSWGLYYIGSMDGTGLLSQAIDDYSKQGVIFVTSAGNNGGEKFHITHKFNNDTIHSGIGFYTFNHPLMWGQSISMWGEPDEKFSAELLVLNNQNETVFTSPRYSTNATIGYLDTMIVIGSDTVFYNLSVSGKYEFNDRPTMRLRVRERSNNIKVALRSFANTGTVHYWNVVELTNDAGNWGGTFDALLPGWIEGDDEYSLGDPASTESAISVAAHASEVRLQNGNVVGGRQANFTSKGPTLDGRRKPDISAPGVSVASSVSSYTTSNYTLLESVDFKGRSYPFSRVSGTSMASPAVAGVIALMLDANPNLSYIDVKAILKITARLDDNTGIISDTSDLSWGWGKVNASQAVKLAEDWVPSLKLPISETKQIYPNPASIQLHAGLIDATYCTLYSVDGKQVMRGLIGFTKSLNVRQLVAGTYIVRFDSLDIETQKLVIIRP